VARPVLQEAEPDPRAWTADLIEEALQLYRQMLIVRTVELRIESLHKRDKMSGSFHSSLGQEACAVGVCSALRESDLVTSTHRGHGHAVAKGVPLVGIFAELLGRAGGVSGGRGGSMHLHHRQSGFLGENAIVAGGLPWAAGAAWARRRKGGDDVAVSFIGDGGFAQGVTHEILLLARHWSSPILIVCENNGFAHSMPSERLFGPPGAIARMVEATGLTAVNVDGRDVLAVAESARTLVAEARKGKPVFLECSVFRVRPHSLTDPDHFYRPEGAGKEWLELHDPIAMLRMRLEPLAEARLGEIDTEVEALVVAASDQAEADEATPESAARVHVYSSSELDGRG
jgi:TPP-dependent pyruvate/acetoin dehydrogenase alpha subunit